MSEVCFLPERSTPFRSCDEALSVLIFPLSVSLAPFRVKDLSKLPLGLNEQKSVQTVRDWYMQVCLGDGVEML